MRPEDLKFHELYKDMERVIMQQRKAGELLKHFMEFVELKKVWKWKFEEGEEVLDKVSGKEAEVVKRALVRIRRR